MSDDQLTFNRGAVRPVECLREGWELIKGTYWLFMGIAVVAMLIASAASIILLGPMMCGLYLCLLRHERGKPVKFEMLFRGFDYFVPSLIATLIMAIPIVVIALPAYIIFIVAMIASMPQKGPGAPPPDPNAIWTIFAGMGLFILVIIVVSIAVAVLFFFIYPLIVDRKLTGVQAIRTSIRAVRANLAGVLGLVLLIYLLDIVGVLACYVGWFFVMPIHFAAIAVAYRKVFPRLDEPAPDDQNEADYGPQLEADGH
jgi:uncharacterized membrane protein